MGPGSEHESEACSDTGRPRLVFGSEPHALPKHLEPLRLAEPNSEAQLVFCQVGGEGTEEAERTAKPQVDPTQVKARSEFKAHGGRESGRTAQSTQCTCKCAHGDVEDVAAAKHIEPGGSAADPGAPRQHSSFGRGEERAQVCAEAEPSTHGGRSLGAGLEHAFERQGVLRMCGCREGRDKTEDGKHCRAPEWMLSCNGPAPNPPATLVVSDRQGLSVSVIHPRSLVATIPGSGARRVSADYPAAVSASSPPTRAWPVLLTLFLAPALLGAAVGLVGERSLLGAMLLWGEPLLAAVVLYGVLAQVVLIWRPLQACALALGAACGALALHPGVEPTPIYGAEADWSERLRDCVNALEVSTEPVRFGLWTHAGRLDRDALATFVSSLDVLVLVGPDARGASQAAELQLHGARKVLPGDTPSHDIALVVRGQFRSCGGEDQTWEMPLPADEPGGARALLSFPAIVGKGTVPLLAVALDRPDSARTVFGWPERVVEGSRHLSALVRALGPQRVVVLGDFQAPRAYRGLRAHLLGADLSSVHVPATWPARIGSMPALPVHPLDRAWHGTAWSKVSAEAPVLGLQPRRPLVVELRADAGR